MSTSPLIPFTKILGWYEKTAQDLQLRQELLRYPIACQLLFQRRQAEIEAELVQKRLYMIDVPIFILQGGQDTPDALAKSRVYGFLATFGDLGWGKAEGRRQKAEGRRKKDIIEILQTSLHQTFEE